MENTQKLLEQINIDLKQVLSAERYIHSVGVMRKAEELAKKYHVDVEKAKLVGLAHDIAKEMSKKEKLEYVKKHQITIDKIEKVNVGLLHAKIGADICRRKYGFSQDMQDAIIYHTTGAPNMDMLAKILLVADKTEDGRKYQDLEKAKQLADIDLDKAIIYIIDISIQKTIQRGSLIHPLGVETRNAFIQKLS